MAIQNILAIVFAIALTVVCCFLYHLLDGDGGIKPGRIILSGVIGVLVGAAHWFAPLGGDVATIITVAMVIVVGYLAFLGGTNVSRWHELLLLLAALLVTGYVVIDAAGNLSPGTEPVVRALPLVAVVGAVGYVLADFYIYHARAKHKRGQDLSKGSKALYGLAAALSIVLALALAIGIIYAAAVRQPVNPGNGGGNSGNGGGEPKTLLETAEENGCHFYNRDLQEDGDVTNDYDFGKSGNIRNAAKANKQLQKTVRVDPARFAADAAWLDANVGTRYTGEFHDGIKQNWPGAINAAKVAFIKDKTLYSNRVDAFCRFLNSATKVEIRPCGLTTDQMFQNPHTEDGVPDVVVLETEDQSGYELVYTFTIKGKIIEVGYRINCGFQPTNVAEVMNITPQPNPTPTPEPEKPTRPTQPEEETESGITPTQPKYNKKTSDAKYGDSEPNDDPTAHEKTKEGSDPNGSDKTNHSDYRKDMDKKKDINGNQRKAGDPNTPSTQAPTGTDVHNNGNSGTGHGGADDTTTVYTPTTSGGKPISSESVVPWGGPTD